MADITAADTRALILDAARRRLLADGYAGLSTRKVAEQAQVPVSQLHYHFGSKQGLVLALFEYLNAQLLHRQSAMFGDANLTLSQKWALACDYLDEDIASGYVRVLQELIAASWADARVAKVVRAALMEWIVLLTAATREAEVQFGRLGSFAAGEIGMLVGMAFIGAESAFLLGFEAKGLPVRQALRRVGDLIHTAEAKPKRG